MSKAGQAQQLITTCLAKCNSVRSVLAERPQCPRRGGGNTKLRGPGPCTPTIRLPCSAVPTKLRRPARALEARSWGARAVQPRTALQNVRWRHTAVRPATGPPGRAPCGRPAPGWRGGAARRRSPCRCSWRPTWCTTRTACGRCGRSGCRWVRARDAACCSEWDSWP